MVKKILISLHLSLALTQYLPASSLKTQSKTDFIAKTKQNRIPGPAIINIPNAKLARNNILIIEGNGFINNLPSAHKVHLKPIIDNQKQNSYPKQNKPQKNIKSKAKKPKNKNKLIKLKVVESKVNLLKVQIPEDLAYGDYELIIKLKTRFFKSRLSKSQSMIELRPSAPAKPKLKYDVINQENQIKDLIEDQNLILDIEKLKTGLNQISSYYIEDGFESLRSENSNFYYLPETELEKELDINSEKPIEAYAIEKTLNKIDVSQVTKSEEQELEKNFFLITPNNPKYLLHQIILKALYIDQIHVSGDEFAILKNRSSKDIDISNCYLSDSIKKRFDIAVAEIIKAKSSYEIKANLGLNDTGDDFLSFHCPSSTDPKQFELIDQFNYNKISEDGFAIKN